MRSTVAAHARRHIVGYVALFVALSGTSYAAATRISGSQLKNRSVAGIKLKKHTISGTEINARRLGTVPQAAFANRSLVQKAFEARGLEPNVVLTALDANVIKTYVELGLGVGILAKMAFDPKRDRPLVDPSPNMREKPPYPAGDCLGLVRPHQHVDNG